MADLGKNAAVDDISAERLDKLRKELAPMLTGLGLLDPVMIRVADAMHDACTATWDTCEDVVRSVFPEQTL